MQPGSLTTGKLNKSLRVLIKNQFFVKLPAAFLLSSVSAQDEVSLSVG